MLKIVSFFLILSVVVVLGLLLGAIKLAQEFSFSNQSPTTNQYRYKRKNFFMTRAEHEFYDVLLKTIGNEYLVFAQVHLPTIVDHTIRGQNWRAALAHINRKSVDFVLCDKTYISPKLAIELDDRSHERPDRQERDEVVEGILKDAGIPLLRIQNHGAFSAEDLLQKIHTTLN